GRPAALHRAGQQLLQHGRLPPDRCPAAPHLHLRHRAVPVLARPGVGRVADPRALRARVQHRRPAGARATRMTAARQPLRDSGGRTMVGEDSVTTLEGRLTAPVAAPEGERRPDIPEPVVLEAAHVSAYYGAFRALADISLRIPERKITALIGPSGCGKSTLLRCMNRMNDVVKGFRLEGELRYRGEDLYAKGVDVVEVRRRIGMVF